MAIAPEVSSSTDPNPIEDGGEPVSAPGLNYFVFALFFTFGGGGAVARRAVTSCRRSCSASSQPSRPVSLVRL